MISWFWLIPLAAVFTSLGLLLGGILSAARQADDDMERLAATLLATEGGE